jgi:hypothetical protein
LTGCSFRRCDMKRSMPENELPVVFFTLLSLFQMYWPLRLPWLRGAASPPLFYLLFGTGQQGNAFNMVCLREHINRLGSH